MTHLFVAADVANGSKHMRLTDPKADGSRQTRNSVTWVGGRGLMHTFWVQDARPSGREFEAVELADLCIAEWTSYIDDHGLTIPA